MVQSIDDARRRQHTGGRVPPHNLEAEESLLGAMLLSNDAIAAAVNVRLNAGDFYKPAHAHIYDAITSTGKLEPSALPPVELLVLVAPVKADEPPRQVVVHGRHRLRWHNQAEQRERAVSGAEEQPLADPAAHPALGRRLLVPLRKPRAIGEEPAEERLDQLAGAGGRGRLVDPRPGVRDELAHERDIEDELVLVERRQRLMEVAHGSSLPSSLTRARRRRSGRPEI